MRHSAAPPEPLLHLWGRPRLVADGHTLSFGAERRFQLLLLLALQGGDGVERDRAAALLWPQRPLADARRNLRKVLHDAHGLLPAGALQVTEHALAWPVQTDWALAERAWRAGRIDEALSLLPALPPGQVLAGLADASNPAYDEWLSAQRQRLSSAWQGLMQAALAAAGTEAQLRLRLARRALDEDPIYEPAVAVLVEHDQAQGHATQARRRYDDYAAALQAALGVEPSRALRERLRDLAVPAPL
ncbi:MAG: BTAD domain-containing putative transcriptional regulator, partial [Aquabacterium sp.]